jgi:alpha/beta superfamily hydrolase
VLGLASAGEPGCALLSAVALSVPRSIPDFPLGLASAVDHFWAHFHAILYRTIPDTPRYADKKAAKTASQIASTSLRALIENLGLSSSPRWVDVFAERLMRSFVAIFSFLLATFSFAQSDLAREARWRAEVEPNIVVGDAQTLRTKDGREFFAIFTEGKQKDIAFVLVHGVGVNPDFGFIGRLRVLLADAGYATLSIQMPVLANEGATPEAYQNTFPDATARVAAAHVWLADRSYKQVVLASHSMGAWMSNVYLQNTPNSPYAAWIAIGVTGRILSIGSNSLPILDLYGENDLPANLKSAWLRRIYLWSSPRSQQIMIAKADHHYANTEKDAANAIVQFVRNSVH